MWIDVTFWTRKDTLILVWKFVVENIDYPHEFHRLRVFQVHLQVFGLLDSWEWKHTDQMDMEWTPNSLAHHTKFETRGMVRRWVHTLICPNGKFHCFSGSLPWQVQSQVLNQWCGLFGVFLARKQLWYRMIPSSSPLMQLVGGWSSLTVCQVSGYLGELQWFEDPYTQVQPILLLVYGISTWWHLQVWFYLCHLLWVSKSGSSDISKSALGQGWIGAPWRLFLFSTNSEPRPPWLPQTLSVQWDLKESVWPLFFVSFRWLQWEFHLGTILQDSLVPSIRELPVHNATRMELRLDRLSMVHLHSSANALWPDHHRSKALEQESLWQDLRLLLVRMFLMENWLQVLDQVDLETGFDFHWEDYWHFLDY